MAVDALLRIDDGAYANLVLPHVLERADLTAQDRNFATELVYGATRMRRACDWLVDRYLMRPPDAETRGVLRLGAYQLEFLRTPPHAAVSATVAVAPRRTRGLVNAVLRRVAAAGSPHAAGAAQGWPDDATRLSYPDWIVDRLTLDLGADAADAALSRMNSAPGVTTRDDGYVQDRASQWVAAVVGDGPGTVADLCAAPGGKATLIASGGASLVVGADVRPSRAGLVAANVAQLGLPNVAVLVADAVAPALRPGSLDRVLVDAPCSGLGVLRRRADARWRVSADDVEALAVLQQVILEAAAGLVRPGGLLVYSVCTLTAAETTEIDGWLAATHPGWEPIALGPPWRPAGRGGRLLPQDEDTDGMFVLALRGAGPSINSTAVSPPQTCRIAPSILSADFADLAGAINRVAADTGVLHVDVMDGHFVPNLTIGPPVVAAINRHTDITLDCHLMMTNPGDYLEAFRKAGADWISVHIEIGDTSELVDAMRALGVRPGLAINPETPFETIAPWVGRVDHVLVMTVHPGFGGQSFMPEVMPKLRQIAEAAAASGTLVEVDGGIGPATIGEAASAGARCFVAGNAVFGQADPGAAVRELHRLASEAIGPLGPVES